MALTEHRQQQRKTSVAWDNFNIPVSASLSNLPPSSLTPNTHPGAHPHPHLHLFDPGCLGVPNCFLELNYFHPCTPPCQVPELQEDVECQNYCFVPSCFSLQQRRQEASTNHSLSHQPEQHTLYQHTRASTRRDWERTGRKQPEQLRPATNITRSRGQHAEQAVR